MSRSIHTTIHDYSKERRYDLADEEIKDSRLKEIKDGLHKKRLIKKSNQISKRISKLSLEMKNIIEPQAIPIQTIDMGPYMHYPASKEDLIGVAKKLPFNIMTGIESISFCLGKEYQEEEWEGIGEKEFDPFVGRVSYKTGPVYIPPVLGVYNINTTKIFLFAYVYDEAILNISLFVSYLRLKMLETFVHEVAHHDDNMRRTGRGRWFMNNKSKCEDYAELQEQQWAEMAIVPYLIETYPEEYLNLNQWIKKNGGVDIPLTTIVSEPKGRFLSYDSALMYMFENEFEGKNSRDVMFEFAHDLHVGDHYDECMKSLEILLINNPSDAEALGLKADTLIHLGKYNEAERFAQECLAIDNANIDAIEALCNVEKERKNWNALIVRSSQGLSLLEDGSWRTQFFLEQHLIASLFLKDYSTAQKDAEKLSEKGHRKQRKQAFQSLVMFLTGNYNNALISADVLSQEKVIGSAKAILHGIKKKAFEMKLSGVTDKVLLTDYEKEFLSRSGIGELLSLT